MNICSSEENTREISLPFLNKTLQKSNLLVSFIIPTCSDNRIYSAIKRITATLEKLAHEIIIVDDSDPETFESLCKHSKKEYDNRIKVIRGDRQGKGSAIKKGIFASSGDIVFYIDADLPISLDKIEIFISKIVYEHFDIVIAERQLNFERLLTKPIRFLFSLALLLIQRLFIFHSFFFYDTQCGFKAFRYAAIKILANLQTVNRGMFDIEYLYIARKRRLKITKVRTFETTEEGKTRINLMSCILTDPIDLIKIKFNGLTGKYTSIFRETSF